MKFLLLILLVPAFASAETVKSSKSTEPVKAMKIKTRVMKKDTAAAFDEEVDALMARLDKEKDPRKRYDDFANVSMKLARLKNLGPRPASEEKALEMALVVETFDGLPAKKEFNPAKCPSYVEEAELRMGNRSGDQPEDPGVVRGLKILKAVCRP